MKFKNDKLSDARTLTITDRCGDTLNIKVFVDDNGHQTITQTGDGACVGMTRKKLVKLAYAIIEELNPGGI